MVALQQSPPTFLCVTPVFTPESLLLQLIPHGWHSETLMRASLGQTTSMPTISRYLGKGRCYVKVVFSPVL